jgi:hypothetical protein
LLAPQDSRNNGGLTGIIHTNIRLVRRAVKGNDFPFRDRKLQILKWKMLNLRSAILKFLAAREQGTDPWPLTRKGSPLDYSVSRLFLDLNNPA